MTIYQSSMKKLKRDQEQKNCETYVEDLVSQRAQTSLLSFKKYEQNCKWEDVQIFVVAMKSKSNRKTILGGQKFQLEVKLIFVEKVNDAIVQSKSYMSFNQS